jgi:acid-sensing ion channel, other
MKLCDIQRMECSYPYQKVLLEDYSHLYSSDGVCKCLPECNSIEYKIDFFEERHDESYDESFYDYITIEFRFRYSEYFPLIRYQEFKTQDFLSYVGGLLGLFAGVSVLSIIEFVYFFTLRILTNVVRYIRH